MILLLNDGRLAYSGIDMGQPGIPSAQYPGAFKWVQLPRTISDGDEAITDVFVHGDEGNQRYFILTDAGSLYSSGYNSGIVCLGGYASNIQPSVVGTFKIPLPL